MVVGEKLNGGGSSSDFTGPVAISGHWEDLDRPLICLDTERSSELLRRCTGSNCAHPFCTPSPSKVWRVSETTRPGFIESSHFRQHREAVLHFPGLRVLPHQARNEKTRRGWRGSCGWAPGALFYEVLAHMEGVDICGSNVHSPVLQTCHLKHHRKNSHSEEVVTMALHEEKPSWSTKHRDGIQLLKVSMKS